MVIKRFTDERPNNYSTNMEDRADTYNRQSVSDYNIIDPNLEENKLPFKTGGMSDLIMENS